MPGEPVDVDFTIDDLTAHSGVPVRTIRYYIAEGLLPGPGGRGRAASYTEDHLLRLRLIRLLVEQRVPLAEIRARLGGLSTREIQTLLQEEARREARLARVAEAPSPKAYIGALLDRARRARPSPQPLAAVASAAAPAPTHPFSAAPARAPARGSAAEAASPLPAEADASGGHEALSWHRRELAPGIELHVRSDVERERPDLVARIASLASSLVAAAVPGRSRNRS